MFSPGSWILVTMPFALLGALYLWRWKIDGRKERVPVSVPLLRPPGESLRSKIAELDEELGDRLLLAILWPFGLALVSRIGAPVAGWGVDLAYVMFGSVGFGFFGVRVFRTANKLRD